MAEPGIIPFVEVARLPWADFPLDNPCHLRYGPLMELLEWILKREQGELSEENVFQWKRQRDPGFITPFEHEWWVVFIIMR